MINGRLAYGLHGKIVFPDDVPRVVSQPLDGRAGNGEEFIDEFLEEIMFFHVRRLQSYTERKDLRRISLK